MSGTNGNNNGPSLKEEGDQLVTAAGGWFNVIARLAPIFSQAISNIGHLVDCPFPERHRNGGGRDDFRFSSKAGYEGRSICSCKQDGWMPVDLLIEAGVGSSFTAVYREIKKAYKGNNGYEAKAAPVIQRRRARPTAEENRYRSNQLKEIVKDLMPLSAPGAKIGRLYFRNRGIPLDAAIGNVKFHPALPYFHRYRKNGVVKKEVVGCFPAIVTAFTNQAGKVMNLHRIYLTEDGRKLDHPKVSKPKKICSGLDGWNKTKMDVATIPGCRTLHICEGVEKAWAIHLATRETVRAAYSCTSLPGQYVDRSEFDDIVLWSDHDPYNDVRKAYGDGQTYMWKLYLELMRQGFNVCFMLPDTNPTKDAKGPDWEDIIVSEDVRALPVADRFQHLRSRACEGGIFTPTGHSKKRSDERFEELANVA